LLFMQFRSDIWSAAIAASMLAVGAAPLAAQSLADVARQEEARRKEIRQPAKVYTNKDLVSVPSPSPPPQTASSATVADATGKDAAKDAAKDSSKDPQGKDAKDPGAVKDQAYWSKRMKDLTAQLDRDQTFFDALQSRVNALSADFAARDDPAQRAAIGRDRQKATDELERLRLAILSDKKATADFQEEARRASVPPGWLR
jgi:hypothetical protein